MADIEYAILATDFLVYDGTNSQQIADAISFRVGSYAAVIVSADANGAIFTMDLDYRIMEMNMATGDRLALATGDVVTPAMWSTRYAKP